MINTVAVWVLLKATTKQRVSWPPDDRTGSIDMWTQGMWTIIWTILNDDDVYPEKKHHHQLLSCESSTLATEEMQRNR